MWKSVRKTPSGARVQGPLKQKNIPKKSKSEESGGSGDWDGASYFFGIQELKKYYSYRCSNTD
ncbi:MAG: hypothetical protein VX294_13170 [Candidatus Latescibacterota bacterium]|nr:hypothetical protein [Candidatus Latescibacterota bacterium]